MTEDTSQPAPGAPAVPGVTRWRKKPIIVSAIQWTGEDFPAVKAFASDALGILELGGGALPLWVVKSQAVCYVERGDWIIRETDGSGFYPCAESVFAATYELAAEAAQKSAAADPPEDTSRARPTLHAPSRDRTGATLDEAAERDPADAAKLAAIRACMAGFFAHYGNSTAPSLLLARDLAEGIRQILDRTKSGTEEAGHG